MNSSQSKFNQSQSQMRKTNQTNPGEFGATNLGQLTQTGNNFAGGNSSNAATLKGKLASLEEQIQLNYNNMTLIKTQNKIIDKLQKELLFHNMLKKSKKYLSTNYSNMNTNIWKE